MIRACQIRIGIFPREWFKKKGHLNQNFLKFASPAMVTIARFGNSGNSGR